MNRHSTLLSILVLVLTCQSAQAQFCPADTNGDATVNTGDLLNVLNAWGYVGPPPAGPVPRPDTNGDEAVNVIDLLAVINAWGSCRAGFTLEEIAGGEGFMNWDYCIYQVTARDPGSALQIGNIVCVQCPDNLMNACPVFTLSTFNGVTGAPGAVSTGVTITPTNGFCQPCPANSRGSYRRTS